MPHGGTARVIVAAAHVEFIRPECFQRVLERSATAVVFAIRGLAIACGLSRVHVLVVLLVATNTFGFRRIDVKVTGYGPAHRSG
jgi:hypothetical protein